MDLPVPQSRLRCSWPWSWGCWLPWAPCPRAYSPDLTVAAMKAFTTLPPPPSLVDFCIILIAPKLFKNNSDKNIFAPEKLEILLFLLLIKNINLDWNKTFTFSLSSSLIQRYLLWPLHPPLMGGGRGRGTFEKRVKKRNNIIFCSPVKYGPLIKHFFFAVRPTFSERVGTGLVWPTFLVPGWSLPV